MRETWLDSDRAQLIAYLPSQSLKSRPYCAESLLTQGTQIKSYYFAQRGGWKYAHFELEYCRSLSVLGPRIQRMWNSQQKKYHA